MSKEYLLQMSRITKEFPGVKALSEVDFNVGFGEVHALMGENGAGKSTLIKILTGIYEKNSGTIILDDKKINPKDSLAAQKCGISTIYQELNLIPTLSICENIFIGREPKNRGVIDWAEIEKQSKKLLKDMGLVEDIDVYKPLGEQSVSIQQLVAIARAISIKSKLIIMDESTSSLNEHEVQILFDVIRNLKAQGLSIVFISHKLDEIFEICDRVTVLKDGCRVDEYEIKNLTKLKLVSAMIGRDASQIMKSHKKYSDDLEKSSDFICEAKELKCGYRVHNIDINIKRGEVLGIAGLLGSGRTETAQILFGDTPPESGEIIFENKKVKFSEPLQAIRMGIGLCTEDRKANGIFPHMSVADNMTIVLLPHLVKNGIISKTGQRKVAEKFIKALRIKTPNIDQEIRFLSGGNQQKVLLARWLCTNPSMMILDEPTRGIDVGAKSEIESIIADLAKEGIGVMMISSELEELVRDCDRITVLRDGRAVSEFSGDAISEDSIMEAIAHE